MAKRLGASRSSLPPGEGGGAEGSEAFSHLFVSLDLQARSKELTTTKREICTSLMAQRLPHLSR
jgi:hypothetical protein